MTPYEEAVFEAKADKHFRGQPELRNGRDFRMHTFRYELSSGQQKIRENWDRIKWNSKQIAPTEKELDNEKCEGWHKVNENMLAMFRLERQPKCSECAIKLKCNHKDRGKYV